METSKQQFKVFVSKKGQGLDMEVITSKNYLVRIPKDEKYDLDVLEQQLGDGKYKIKEEKGEYLVIVTEGGLVWKLLHCCSKQWIEVGEMEDVIKIRKMYPMEKFELGAKHINMEFISPIRVSYWNHGIRVYFTEMVPHEDDASKFHMGTSLYTKGTLDQQSKDSLTFVHQYVNSNYERCCGCIPGGDFHKIKQIYARRL